MKIQNINISKSNNIFAKIPVFGKSVSTQSLPELKQDTFEANKAKTDFKNSEKTANSTYSKEELEEAKLFAESIENPLAKKAELFEILFNKLNLPDTRALREEINKISLYIFALNNIVNGSNPNCKTSAFSDWTDSHLGRQNVHISNTIYEHPYDKALLLRGILSPEDEKECADLEKTQEKYPTMVLLTQKDFVLTKMQKILNSKKSDILGEFTTKELSLLRRLAKHYHILDNVLAKRGINTKELEKIKFRTIVDDSIMTGDYINGIGLVLNKFKIKGNDTITTLSFDKQIAKLKILNLEKLQDKPILPYISVKSSTQEINSANEIAKEFIKKAEEDSIIAEIQFAPINEKMYSYLTQEVKSGFKDEIEEELKKGGYYTSKFINQNSHRYPNAGKMLGIQLLDLLAKNSAYPIFIRALAYNDAKYSPVNIYRKAGFIPYSHTDDEISKLAKKNGGHFPKDVPVYLYLPENAISKDKVEKWRKIILP